jgi:hypothetical protein
VNLIEFPTLYGGMVDGKVAVDFSTVVAVRRTSRTFDDPQRGLQGFTTVLTFRGGAEIEVAESYDVIVDGFGKRDALSGVGNLPKKSPLV